MEHFQKAADAVKKKDWKTAEAIIKRYDVGTAMQIHFMQYRTVPEVVEAYKLFKQMPQLIESRNQYTQKNLMGILDNFEAAKAKIQKQDKKKPFLIEHKE